MHHILENVTPGLLAKLQECSLGQRRQILAQACELACESIRSVEPKLRNWVEACSRTNALTVVELEEAEGFAEAAEEQDLEERKAADKGGVNNWFEQARLATALVHGFGGSSWKNIADAVYELSTLRDGKVVIEFIRSSVGLRATTPGHTLEVAADLNAQRQGGLVTSVTRKLSRKFARLLLPPTQENRHVLRHLFPIIVPAQYAAHGNWPGPLCPLRHTGAVLTWAVVQQGHAILYLTHAQADSLSRIGIDYHARSMENLRRSTGERPSTKVVSAPDGSTFYIVMQQEDGLGSSRVLMSEELINTFPEGYQIAVPQRSVGIAVSRCAPSTVLDEVMELICKFAAIGSSPLLPALMDPEDLAPKAM